LLIIVGFQLEMRFRVVATAAKLQLFFRMGNSQLARCV